ncbi:helix-turn-helix domain-containing protein [Achromobacter aloeverae]|nr:helix-turn-helix transcriptional regulator [Achromobacter aloeverae]
MDTKGNRLKKIRLEKGLSQEALARKVGCHQTLIGQMEKDKNEGSRYLVKIANVLGVSAEWLESGRGEMMAEWPFPGVSPSDYACLSQDDKDDLLALLISKIQRRGKKIKAA